MLVEHGPVTESEPFRTNPAHGGDMNRVRTAPYLVALDSMNRLLFNRHAETRPNFLGKLSLR